jgi:hypothetical protein
MAKTQSFTITISGVVEGDTDECALVKMIKVCGAEPDRIMGKEGKAPIIKKMRAYSNAGKGSPWVVLIDLDEQHECAPELLREIKTDASSFFSLRIAVRELESWLMADSESFTAFFGINRSVVPANPEVISNPKETLVELCKKSTSKRIRQDVVPRPESGRNIGPAYSSTLIDYIINHWDPKRASARSDSLRKALAAIERLKTAYQNFCSNRPDEQHESDQE